MRNLINSSAGKYVVNVLMIIIFAALAFTGLFGEEGGRGGEGRENRHKQFAELQEKSSTAESAITADFTQHENFAPGQGEKEEGNHNIYGNAWLILMALHTWQHWNWYKLLFSKKHILKNKLVTATVWLFVLMALTSIALLTEVVPRGLINVKEVHEVTGQVLLAFVIVHVIQRVKWYVSVTKKLFNRRSVAA